MSPTSLEVGSGLSQVEVGSRSGLVWVGSDRYCFMIGSIRLSDQSGSGRVGYRIAHLDRFLGSSRIRIRSGHVGFLGSDLSSSNYMHSYYCFSF